MHEIIIQQDEPPFQQQMILPIKELDNRFIHIQQLIDAKKQMLLDKQRKLRNIAKQNNFLDVVKDDYQKYHNYIYQQKNEQIKAFNLLDEYIKDLTHSGTITKHNIEDAKEEQNKILNEINNIKNSLDKLIKSAY